MDVHPSACTLGLTINSLLSSGQKSKSMIRNIKKELNNKTDALIVKLCVIVVEHYIQHWPSFPLQRWFILKYAMASKRKNKQTNKQIKTN